jgi:hypothetical protein
MLRIAGLKCGFDSSSSDGFASSTCGGSTSSTWGGLISSSCGGCASWAWVGATSTTLSFLTISIIYNIRIEISISKVF